LSKPSVVGRLDPAAPGTVWIEHNGQEHHVEIGSPAYERLRQNKLEAEAREEELEAAKRRADEWLANPPPLGGPGDFNVYDCNTGRTVARRRTYPTPRARRSPRSRPVRRRGSRRTAGTRGPPDGDPDLADEEPEAPAFTAPALAYFRSHAIMPDVATRAGVREERGALVFRYTARDGSNFERRRNLAGAVAKTLQPRGVPLSLYWPMGRPA
jgi:hypothetical protein